MIKSGEKLEYFAQKISGKVVQRNAQEYGIIWRILAKTVRNFYLIFSRLHPVYTEAFFARKGGLLGQTNFLCKMFRKSLTCADFQYIICLVIRAQFSRQNNGLLIRMSLVRVQLPEPKFPQKSADFLIFFTRPIFFMICFRMSKMGIFL